jgi:hypothetical protein
MNLFAWGILALQIDEILRGELNDPITIRISDFATLSGIAEFGDQISATKLPPTEVSATAPVA